MPLSPILDLNMLPSTPKPSVTSFAISLIILQETVDKTQQNQWPSASTAQARGRKNPYKAVTNFLKSRGELGVI